MSTQEPAGSEPKRKRGRPRKAAEPVPEWMDPKLGEHVKDLSMVERLNTADRLEAVVKQLRSFNREVEREAVVSFHVTPEMAIAAELFHKRFSEKPQEELKDRINTGARWILEIAMQHLGEMAARTTAQIAYRIAEGFGGNELIDDMVRVSIASWREKMRQELDDEDDD
jgi:hypothetical protein